jgi:hypothetical protein
VSSCGRPWPLANPKPYGLSGSPANSQKPFPFFSEPRDWPACFLPSAATCYFQLSLSPPLEQCGGRRQLHNVWSTLFTPTAMYGLLTMCLACSSALCSIILVSVSHRPERGMVVSIFLMRNWSPQRLEAMNVLKCIWFCHLGSVPETGNVPV